MGKTQPVTKTEHLHRIPGGIVIASMNHVVIDARRTFGCAHTYVALKISGVQLFVCARCEYRTELLPLAKQGSSSGRAALVNINRVRRRPLAVDPSYAIGRR